jgi:heme exporter protein B
MLYIKSCCSIFFAIIAHDIRCARRIGGAGTLTLLFMLMLLTIMPLALGPDLALLARLSAALMWLAAVLTTLIGLDRLFQADEEEGGLTLLRLSELPFSLVVLAKISAHWLTTGAVLALAVPLLGVLVALPLTAIIPLMLTFLVGTPALTALGAVGAAFAVQFRRGGLLLAVTVLPLMIPILIFGVSAAETVLNPTGTISFYTPFMILSALSLLTLVASVLAAHAMLRKI